MKTTKLVALLLTASLAAGLAGCAPTTGGSSGSAATPAPGGAAAPAATAAQTGAVSSDYLVWNIGMEPKTWDPQLNTSGAGGHVVLNLYDGLVRDSLDGIKMASAEKYDLSANAEGVAETVYTFHLRDGLQWSDGKPVTAGDFEYAWKRACSPEMASPYAFLITDYIKGAYEYFSGTGTREDVAVKALDDKTLQVELIQPTAYFLNLVSFFTYMPCREDMASTGEGWEKDPAKCVTNGAFTLDEYKIGSHLTLKKNDKFWNADSVNLAGIKALFITDATTSLQGYQAGEIQVTSILPGEEIPRLLAEDPNFTSQPALGTIYYEFNMDVAPANDLNVRRALTLAIDRAKITDQLLRDGTVPAVAFVAPPFKLSTGESMRALDPSGKVMEEYGVDPNAANVEKAQEYLAAAGYPGGQGFPALDLLYYESGSQGIIAEAVQQMWEQNLGIKVNLKVQEFSVFSSTVGTNEWTVAQTGWSADYNDPMTMLSLFTAEGHNETRWRYKAYSGVPDDVTLNPENEAYDIAVKSAAAANGAERDAFLKQAEDILMDNQVICPLYYTTYTQVIDYNKVTGPGRTPIGQWDFQYFTMVG